MNLCQSLFLYTFHQRVAGRLASISTCHNSSSAFLNHLHTCIAKPCCATCIVYPASSTLLLACADGRSSLQVNNVWVTLIYIEIKKEAGHSGDAQQEGMAYHYTDLKALWDEEENWSSLCQHLSPAVLLTVCNQEGLGVAQIVSRILSDKLLSLTITTTTMSSGPSACTRHRRYSSSHKLQPAPLHSSACPCQMAF